MNEKSRLSFLTFLLSCFRLLRLSSFLVSSIPLYLLPSPFLSPSTHSSLYSSLLKVFKFQTKASVEETIYCACTEYTVQGDCKFQSLAAFILYVHTVRTIASDATVPRCYQQLWSSTSCPLPTQYPYRSRIKIEERQRSSLLFGGQNLFNFLLRWIFCLGRFWRIEFIIFLANHTGAILPIIVHFKTAITNSLQKRRPLPFLLSLSFFYASTLTILDWIC